MVTDVIPQLVSAVVDVSLAVVQPQNSHMMNVGVAQLRSSGGRNAVG